MPTHVPHYCVILEKWCYTCEIRSYALLSLIHRDLVMKYVSAEFPQLGFVHLQMHLQKHIKEIVWSSNSFPNFRQWLPIQLLVISERLSKCQIAKGEWLLGVSSLYDDTSTPFLAWCGRTHQTPRLTELFFGGFVSEMDKENILSWILNERLLCHSERSHYETIQWRHSLCFFSICDLLFAIWTAILKSTVCVIQ